MEKPPCEHYGHNFNSFRLEDLAYRGWERLCTECGARDRATVEDAITLLATELHELKYP